MSHIGGTKMPSLTVSFERMPDANQIINEIVIRAKINDSFDQLLPRGAVDFSKSKGASIK